MKILTISIFLLVSCLGITAQVEYLSEQETNDIRDVLLDNVLGYDEASDYIMDSIMEVHPSSYYVKHLVYRAQSAVFSYNGEFEKSIEYSHLSMDAAAELQMWDEYLYEWKNLSITYQDMGQIDKAHEILDSILNHPATPNDQELLAETYSIYGYNYELDNDYLTALKYYQLSADAIEKDTTTTLQINEPYSSMAIIYKSIREYGLAVEYLEKALVFNKKNPDTWLNAYSVYNVWGDIYYDNGDLQKAEEYQRKSIEIVDEEVGSFDIALVDPLISLSNIYIKQKDPRAQEIIDRIISIGQETNSELTLLSGYLLKGKYLNDESKHNQAISVCKKAESLLEDYAQIIDEHNCYECLLQGYKGLGNHEKAMSLYDQVIQLKEDLLNETKISDITEMRLTSSFIKTQLQDSLANAQSIALLEKDKEILAANNRNIAFGLGGTAFITLLTLFGFFRLRKQNEVISNQKKSLEDLNSIKDQIFAIIGHDLRKPAIAFNGLSRKVNYLLQKKDYEGLDKLGEQIESNGFSLQKIIDNLLNWALAQRSVVPYHPESVDLTSLAEDLIQSVQPRLNEKGISLINKIDKDQEVWSDKNSLYTVLLNLIDNAIKYTPEGGEIELDTIRTDDQLKITVQDTGEGMTVQQINQLFLLSKDKSKRGTQGEKGTGLGLHIANELVKINKGIIEVSSNIGQGSRFDVILPLAA